MIIDLACCRSTVGYYSKLLYDIPIYIYYYFFFNTKHKVYIYTANTDTLYQNSIICFNI